MNIWYVKHPTSLYKEDIRELAKVNGLKIIDSKFQGNNKQCENAPKLTLVNEVEEIITPKKTKAKKGE